MENSRAVIYTWNVRIKYCYRSGDLLEEFEREDYGGTYFEALEAVEYHENKLYVEKLSYPSFKFSVDLRAEPIYVLD